MRFRYNFKFILFIYILTALIGGYGLGIIAGVAIHIQNSFKLDDGQLSYLIGLLFLGGIIAKFFWLSADYISRKRILIIVLLTFIVATFLFINSVSYTSLEWSRLFQGAAILLSYYAFPVYMTEIALPEKRGMYVTLYQLMWAGGIAISSLAVLMFDNFVSWQEFYDVPMYLLILVTIGILFIPYSPVWLISRNRIAEAKDVYKKLFPELTEIQINERILSTKESLFKEKNSTNKVRNLFDAKSIKIIFIVTLLLILNQLSGNNVVLLMNEKVLQSIDSYSASLNMVSFLVMFVNFGATILTVIYADKLGRKKVFYIGLIIAIISYVFLSLSFFIPIKGLQYYLVLIFLVLAVGGLAFGPAGIIITIINEMLPNRVRVIGIFIAGMTTTIFTFFFASSFLNFADKFGYGALFLILAGVCVVYMLIVKLTIVETAGKTLEEIEQDFRTKNG
ncbi:hypothetical protein LO80_07905 [Candidatus Francisella endociliophora]|uniref:Major facilitator superfamily (MFS) profile domain-containing protein n=1 Tax=Candidatus Francisella endociliophora TaxID=653937 RepID=A0A097EQQ3_9GAMM|nr:MFS transporter [Francisella sp. FSC1006]AIT09898.1 hypothetical protein LO80_07905 [Francisella sp. FSC1006]